MRWICANVGGDETDAWNESGGWASLRRSRSASHYLPVELVGEVVPVGTMILVDPVVPVKNVDPVDTVIMHGDLVNVVLV